MSSPPKIEMKRPHGKMARLLFQERARAEAVRRELSRLELAMVENGYGGKSGQVWIRSSHAKTDTKMQCVSWVQDKLRCRGKHIADLSSNELLFVMEHLPGLLDQIEGNQRWLVRQLETALETLHAFVEKVRAEPFTNPNPDQEQHDATQDPEPDQQ
jgi:hypothetical protein